MKNFIFVLFLLSIFCCSATYKPNFIIEKYNISFYNNSNFDIIIYPDTDQDWKSFSLSTGYEKIIETENEEENVVFSYSNETSVDCQKNYEGYDFYFYNK